MMPSISRRTLMTQTLAGSVALGVSARPLSALASPPVSPVMQEVLGYAREQRTTGLLVIENGRTLVEENWPAPTDDPVFANFVYERTSGGALLEDVASQQKSFVSMLVAVAIDKGLLDIARPVSDIIGPGWSKANRVREAEIRVIDVLTMSSGLRPDFTFQAPPGTVFFYNTPVYAVTKAIVSAAAKLPLETITHDWLTAPAGMRDTSWRKRPAAFGDVGNPTGLVTSPRDTARFGQIVLDGGVSASGRRIVSATELAAMFTRSKINPAYGRLWWLNGGSFTIKALATRVDGPLIPAAPVDLVAALGALDRKLYIVPSRKLIVVRMGDAAPDRNFDQEFWLRLAPALA